MKLRELLFIANYLTVVFVSKMVLAGIPNVQVTFLLMLLFVANFKFHKYFIFLIGFVILEFIAWGYFTLMFPTLFSWLILYFLYKIFNSNNEHILMLIALIFTIIHAITYGIHDIIFIGMPINRLWIYLMSGIPFNLAFLFSSILTIIWLFDPLNRLIKREVIK
ncbi:MAG: hypothetical protein ACOCQD_05035 [archaeon]